ncbi:hypothetical protein LCGC14_2044930, partial [marine sediment metagenome]
DFGIPSTNIIDSVILRVFAAVDVTGGGGNANVTLNVFGSSTTSCTVEITLTSFNEFICDATTSQGWIPANFDGQTIDIGVDNAGDNTNKERRVSAMYLEVTHHSGVILSESLSMNDTVDAVSEALKPNHAAISLDGEPLLFPKISQFIQEFKNRNMTTFIVTNGTLPQKITSLDPLPSQLYITLAAPNEMIYKKTCRPMIRNGWSNIMDSMDLVESLSTRTLIRLTAVKNLNINENLINDYIKIIEKANPNFFEIKGFTLQAKALLIKERLQSDKPIQYYFPDYEFLDYIASKFEEKGNFPLIYKNEVSRDFLFAVNFNKDADPKLKNL